MLERSPCTTAQDHVQPLRKRQVSADFRRVESTSVTVALKVASARIGGPVFGIFGRTIWAISADLQLDFSARLPIRLAMKLPGTFRSQMATGLTVEEESLKVPARSEIATRSISPSDLPGAQRLMGKAKDRIAEEPEQFVESVTQNLFNGLIEKYARLAEEAANSGDGETLEELTLVEPQKLGDHPPEDLLGGIDFETWRAEHRSAPLWGTVEESVNPKQDADRLASWVLFYALRHLEQRLLDTGAVVALTTSGIGKDKKLRELFEEEGYMGILLQRLSADTAGGILAGLQEGQGGDVSLPYIERLLGLDIPSAPSPRPVTPEFDPTPFTGEPPMAEVLADPFANKAVKALRGASGKPSDSYEEEWGRDETRSGKRNLAASTRAKLRLKFKRMGS